jgi:wyosine [tRNA(Phe)-imidazoG37] synthetase (radical SAM superfamily)
MTVVYGPVHSWRLGRSLGIDPLGGQVKRCTYDCVYCQLDPTPAGPVARGVWVEPDTLTAELVAAAGVPADWITFAGMGEPTLASNLGELLDATRVFRSTPIAVLTNGSLLVDRRVRSALRRADFVIVKVDALDEETFGAINRPCLPCFLAEILDGVRAFRRGFRGRMALQVMFVRANAAQADLFAELARSIGPDEIQLNTPLRPSPTPPLPVGAMAEIARAFEGLPAVQVYTAPRATLIPLDVAETHGRYPEWPAGRGDAGAASPVASAPVPDAQG